MLAKENYGTTSELSFLLKFYLVLALYNKFWLVMLDSHVTCCYEDTCLQLPPPLRWTWQSRSHSCPPPSFGSGKEGRQPPSPHLHNPTSVWTCVEPQWDMLLLVGMLYLCFIFYFCVLAVTELGSSVSVVFDYGLDDRAIEVQSPAEAKGYFLKSLCPDRPWGSPSLLSNGYRGSFPRG
jgi:hypothetical protein